MRKYRHQIVAGLAIAFFIYVGLLALTDTQQLLIHLQTYPWALLIPVVALKLVSWGLHFAKWQYYLGVIAARDKISVGDSLALFVAGFTLAVSPGKIAEVVKAIILKTKTGVPIARSVPVIIGERVIDGTSVLTIVFVSLLLGGSVINLDPRAQWFILFATGLIVVGLVAVQIKPLAELLLNIIATIPLINRIHQPLVAFYASTRQVFRPRHVAVTTALGALAYALDSLGMMLVLTGFGLEMSWPLLWQTMFIFGFTAAVGALSGSPNGAGVTELSSGGLYLALIAPNQPTFDAAAVAAAVLIGGFMYKWLRVLVGMVVALVFRRRLFNPAVETTIAEMEAGTPCQVERV
ncbi:MAG: flippase-like domain-containing protein [Chloroflexi bacterium]|nr:flippase-like domain-containing protein [Chloroflexota bacterium]